MRIRSMRWFVAMVVGMGFGLVATRMARADADWLELGGGEGPGQGKRVVLVSGDEEYRSEETLPQLARILAIRHGFDCKVLFAIQSETGVIDPEVRNNIPGLESLEDADLLVLFTRFRALPSPQMKWLADYVESGRPIVALRTSTHAFDLPKGHPFGRYGWRSDEWEGGFGRQVLGETWISHHGDHGKQSTRGIVVAEQKNHPILRGIRDGDIWGPTDVYGVRLPLPEGCEPLVLGQVLSGMQPDDPPVAGTKNDPMMPIAWTRDRIPVLEQDARIFVTTMGASQDFASEGLRRLLVNACYWAVGLEDEIPESADVRLVGKFEPTPFGFGTFRKGVRITDLDPRDD